MTIEITAFINRYQRNVYASQKWKIHKVIRSKCSHTVGNGFWILHMAYISLNWNFIFQLKPSWHLYLFNCDTIWHHFISLSLGFFFCSYFQLRIKTREKYIDIITFLSFIALEYEIKNVIADSKWPTLLCKSICERNENKKTRAHTPGSWFKKKGLHFFSTKWHVLISFLFSNKWNFTGSYIICNNEYAAAKRNIFRCCMQFVAVVVVIFRWSKQF